MKKTICLMVSALLLLTCVACFSKQESNENYTLNVSYGLGGDTDQTILTFDANIGSGKKDIKDIDIHEVLINKDFADMLVRNGPHDSRYKDDYMKITGKIIFNTMGMTKEEIHAAGLLKGFKIIDKDGNETDLFIPEDQKAVE